MPYPYLHMFFGLGAKAIKPSRFSYAMFGATQIAIDLQPLFNRIYPGLLERHTPSHSILGASLIMFLCLVFRIPLGKLLNITIDRTAAFYGAAIGVYSHIILDAIIHKDVSANLFWPIRINSPLYGFFGNTTMILFCSTLGLIGSIWLWRQGKIQEYLLLYKK
jgi:membrane-bound metal-dependent hydrolase YbcI (DUF457 family)